MESIDQETTETTTVNTSKEITDRKMVNTKEETITITITDQEMVKIEDIEMTTEQKRLNQEAQSKNK